MRRPLDGVPSQKHSGFRGELAGVLSYKRAYVLHMHCPDSTARTAAPHGPHPADLVTNTQEAGVEYLPAEVKGLELVSEGKLTRMETSGPVLQAKLVTLAAGAAAGASSVSGGMLAGGADS